MTPEELQAMNAKYGMPSAAPTPNKFGETQATGDAKTNYIAELRNKSKVSSEQMIAAKAKLQTENPTGDLGTAWQNRGKNVADYASSQVKQIQEATPPGQEPGFKEMAGPTARTAYDTLAQGAAFVTQDVPMAVPGVKPALEASAKHAPSVTETALKMNPITNVGMEFMNDPHVKNVVNSVKSAAPGMYDSFKKEHPDLAKMGEDTFNLVAAYFGAKGMMELPGLAKDGVAGIKNSFAAKQVAKIAAEEAALTDFAKPMMSKSETIRAIPKEGLPQSTFKTKGGVMANVTDQERGAAIKGIVDPGEKSFIKGSKQLQDAYVKEGEANRVAVEKSGATYNPSEFHSKLDNLEPASGIKGNADLETKLNNIRARLKQIIKPPSTIGGVMPAKARPTVEILDARRELDNIAKTEVPNLYSDDKFTPFRTEFKNLRNFLNDFTQESVAAKAGPEAGDAFKASLRKGSLIKEASETAAEKGYKFEIGKTGAQSKYIQFVKDNPWKAAVGGATAGLVAGSTLPGIIKSGLGN